MWCYTLFPKILNMSLTGGIVILAVLLLRLLLRRTPKLFSYILWSAVLFRLLCPVSFSSDISVLSLFDAPVSSGGAVEYISQKIALTGYPSAASPVPSVGEALGGPPEAPVAIAALVWLTGIAVMLVYSLIGFCKLRRRLVGAVRLRENIYLADHIGSAFVWGLFPPKIYLPSTLGEGEREYILQHERCHIRRGDHIVKLLAFGALCIHWFNPLVWLAFALAGKDMEMSCDEAVMDKMGPEIRSDYASSLLRLTAGKRLPAAGPLAFGGGSAGDRIKNVLRYKKPAFWVIVLAVLASLAAAVCFLSDPKSHASLQWAQGLNAGDVESIELVVMPQSENRQYKRFSADEFPAVTALLRESRGRYVADPEELDGGSILFYIKTTDGATHRIGNLGNVYLFIDGDWYDAGYAWLSAWDAVYGEGNAPLPEGFFRVPLTMEDVLSLSEKGMALGWEDLAGYAHIETGSGLYIRVYEIDEAFSLWIGGSSADAEPLYVRLVSNARQDDYIDIRTGDVASFLAAPAVGP